MGSIFESLQQECIDAWTNLNQACRKAGIDRSSIEKWKQKNPKSIDTLERLRNAIKEIKMDKMTNQRINA